MRWEDQELSPTIPETKFPEVFFAGLFVMGWSAQQMGTYRRLDQSTLDALIDGGEIPDKASGARIDRLCLYFRVACSLGPGGEHYAVLGTTHFWRESESLYVILHISPQNDWFQIMTLAGDAPTKPVEPTGTSSFPSDLTTNNTSGDSPGGSLRR